MRGEKEEGRGKGKRKRKKKRKRIRRKKKGEKNTEVLQKIVHQNHILPNHKKTDR